MLRLLTVSLFACLQSEALAQLSFNTTIPATYLDISGTGTRVWMNSGQVTTIETTIGNTLLPAGQVCVGANGGVRFRGTNKDLSLNEPLPSPRAFNGNQTLLPLWDRLEPNGWVGDTIYWEEVGELLIIQWEDVPMGSAIASAPRVTFQIQVPSSGPVWARYLYRVVGPGLPSGGSALIGYQSDGWGNDITFSHNQMDAVASGDALSLVGNIEAIPPQVEHHYGQVPTPTSYLDFDSPQVSVGPIAGNDPTFVAAGIASIDLIGTWTAQGSFISSLTGSNVDGRAIISNQGVLSLAEVSDPIDNSDLDSGMEFQFVKPVDRFGWVFVNNYRLEYEVELFLGGASLGTGEFRYDGLMADPHVWVRSGTGSHFDRLVITGRSSFRHWGIDRVSLSAPDISTRYGCHSRYNSTLEVGSIDALGSNVVAADDLTLVATDLPPGTFGIFLTSPLRGQTLFPGGSRGVLCLDGAIGRFNQPSQLLYSGPQGMVGLDLDLSAHPTPTGFAPVMPGETRNYQFWHRDTHPTGPTSNFTNALSVAFE